MLKNKQMEYIEQNRTESNKTTGMISLFYVVFKNKQMEYIEQDRTKSNRIEQNRTKSKD